MTSKIFKSILCVAIAVLAASLIIVTGVMHSHFSDAQVTMLKDELSLAANAVQSLGSEYLETLENDRYRFTLVVPDGSVVYDTHAAADTMENHADREEIQEEIPEVDAIVGTTAIEDIVAAVEEVHTVNCSGKEKPL